jgi:hypothetical protein
MEIIVSEPTVPEATTLTKDDVWGIYEVAESKRVSDGMVVANSQDKCPIFGDIVPYKSATLVCKLEQEREVEYWCDFVMGGGSVSDRKELTGKDKGKVALRADYQCW